MSNKTPTILGITSRMNAARRLAIVEGFRPQRWVVSSQSGDLQEILSQPIFASSALLEFASSALLETEGADGLGDTLGRLYGIWLFSGEGNSRLECEREGVRHVYEF